MKKIWTRRKFLYKSGQAGLALWATEFLINQIVKIVKILVRTDTSATS